MMSEQKPEAGKDTTPVIGPEKSSAPVTITHIPRTLRMFSVGEHEIDMLSASYGSIYQAALGIAVGIAVTSIVTIATVDLSNRAFAAFFGVFVASALASLVLAGLVVIEYRRVSANIKRIKAR